LLAEEAVRLNEVFIKYVTTGRPFVFLKVAMSLDGRIATGTGDSKWITCEDSRVRVHQLRDRVDAVLVGCGTVAEDDPELTTRLPNDDGENPVRVILDGKANMPIDARVLAGRSAGASWVVVGEAAESARVERLKESGAEVIVLTDSDGRIDFNTVLRELGRREVTSLLVEGGKGVFTEALKSGSVDKVLAFVAPVILGGDARFAAVGELGVEKISDALKLRDINIERVGDDVLIEGYVSDVHRSN
jgi:diaminohydroxyphosphoribosylaminopyrimidine deaminase/5-amino-6-(5-phosphoribosylamino)uracil reductase